MSVIMGVISAESVMTLMPVTVTPKGPEVTVVTACSSAKKSRFSRFQIDKNRVCRYFRDK